MSRSNTFSPTRKFWSSETTEELSFARRCVAITGAMPRLRPRAQRSDSVATPIRRVSASRAAPAWGGRSEEHTSELQSLMRISYDVFCMKKKINTTLQHHQNNIYQY